MLNPVLEPKTIDPPDTNEGSGYDPSKIVIIGNLERPEGVLAAEGSLNLKKTAIQWEIDSLGTFEVSIDSFSFLSTEGLTSYESELICKWSFHGLKHLMP